MEYYRKVAAYRKLAIIYGVVAMGMFLVTIGCVIASWVDATLKTLATQSAYVLIIYIIGAVFFFMKKSRAERGY